LALPILPWGLTACLATNDEPSSGHPALAAPLDQARIGFASFRPGEATATLRTLADRIRQLNQSRAVNVTVGLGSSAFTVLGCIDQRPPGLAIMPTFPGDVLDPGRTNADVVLQVEAGNQAGVEAAWARLTAEPPGLDVGWTTAGRRPENAVDEGRALTRNPFGFVEGFANATVQNTPSVEDITLIRSGEAPGWAVGGSFLAARVIQLAQELWDLDPIETQEQIIGRRRDGAWLDGTATGSEPDFAADPDGVTTPLDSHVRRAHPRDGGSAPPLIRRSWTYAGSDAAGTNETGIMFLCFQRDLQVGFEAVQRRLHGQALDLYLLTVGGGYFVVPPVSSTPWEDALLRA
ncbi:MAG TPA: Dyp-type peroxidase, partial [Propionibacteriaceae bacterium]